MNSFRFINSDFRAGAFSRKKLSDPGVDPDAKLLGKIASKVRLWAITDRLVSPYVGRGKDQVDGSETGGYVVELGHIAGRPVPQLWFCRFPKARHRVLAVSLMYRDGRGGRAFENVRRYLSKIQRFIRADDITNAPGFSQLKKPLKISDYGAILSENYAETSGAHFFTVFLNTRPTATNWSRLAELAYDQLKDLMVQVQEAAKTASDSAAPKFATVRTHMEAEHKLRNSRLARLAKARDHFQCVACGMKPETLYGTEVGECLEAHHATPMAGKQKGSRDSLKEIVTLCPNCHKAVHALFAKFPGVAAVRWIRKRVCAYRSENGRLETRRSKLKFLK